jgi:mannose-6-phosphate isomerase-like protein (cupin superfamily)
MTDMILTPAEAQARLIPKSSYVSCPVAFVDCRLPGSHLKRNYSMIGPGVTTAADQHVNLREPHGFNIGAAGMPNGIVNNLHLHFTAEVFMILSGKWTLRWGPNGDDGTFEAEGGAIASIPTWIFRGFTNTGPDDGWIFTTLGGDDTGGIIWHPSILDRAAETGLYLTADNLLVDTTTGATPPAPADRLKPITPEEIAALKRWTPAEMRQRIVTAEDRDWSDAALLDSCLPGCASAIAPVIGAGISQHRGHTAKLMDPHGFSMEWLRIPAGGQVSRFRIGAKMVLLAYKGSCEVVLNGPGHEVALPLGRIDMVSVPAGAWRAIRNSGTEAVELLVMITGDGRKTPEWPAATIEAARKADRAVDASGLIAPAHLLPDFAAGRQMADALEAAQ